MGSSHSKVAPLPSEDVNAERSSRSTKTTGTGCWAGIKKLFSRNTRASGSDADDDDDQFLQIATTAPVVPAPVAVKPEELHRHAPDVVHSDPIGQKRMPIISQEVKSSPVIGKKFGSGRPSTSHSADVRVSTGYFLYYHRYVNDDSDKESSDEDSSDEGDEHGFDADVESDNDEDRTIAPKRIIRRHRRSAHSGKKGKKPKSGVAKMKGKKAAKVSGDVSSDSETSHVTRQRRLVKKAKDDLLRKADGAFSDILRDNGVTSQVDTDGDDEVDFLFLVSMAVVYAIVGVIVFVEI